MLLFMFELRWALALRFFDMRAYNALCSMDELRRLVFHRSENFYLRDLRTATGIFFLLERLGLRLFF